MQVKARVPCYSNTTTDKHSLVVGILLDNSSIENGFNNILTLKTFFQSMLHCMALDEIISGSNSFTDDFDIHVKWPLREITHQPILASAELF